MKENVMAVKTILMYWRREDNTDVITIRTVFNFWFLFDICQSIFINNKMEFIVDFIEI